MDRFVVPGDPVPQGSMKHVGNGRIVSKSTKLKAWREKVAEIVREQAGEPEYLNPVTVRVIFYLRKPPSVKRLFPTVPPDLDKLQRAIGDAISIDVKYLKDDAQIIEWSAKKLYDPEPRVEIEVTRLYNKLETIVNSGKK
jgi:crossover junction endodeoxyribonuclease RusA